jgi:hypothetical protein
MSLLRSKHSTGVKCTRLAPAKGQPISRRRATISLGDHVQPRLSTFPAPHQTTSPLKGVTAVSGDGIHGESVIESCP